MSSIKLSAENAATPFHWLVAGGCTLALSLVLMITLQPTQDTSVESIGGAAGGAQAIAVSLVTLTAKSSPVIQNTPTTSPRSIEPPKPQPKKNTPQPPKRKAVNRHKVAKKKQPISKTLQKSRQKTSPVSNTAPSRSRESSQTNTTSTSLTQSEPKPSEASTATQGQPAASGDPTLKRNYNTALINRLRKHKRYPSAALRRRQEAIITLELSIDAQGKLLSHRLLPPSKYALLNKAVEKMLQRSLPFPPIPKAAREGKNRFTYIIPIEFVLP